MARPAGDTTWARVDGAAFREAALLLVLSCVVLAGSWALRSDRLPLVADARTYELELAAPLVGPEEAILLFDEGVHLFIDTREVQPGSVATIAGALPIRAESFDDDLLDLFDFLMPEDPLVLFGDGDLMSVSTIASRLTDKGYTDLLILDGGVEAWRKAGGEVREADGEAP